jgi:ubiquitin-protein ligase
MKEKVEEKQMKNERKKTKERKEGLFETKTLVLKLVSSLCYVIYFVIQTLNMASLVLADASGSDDEYNYYSDPGDEELIGGYPGKVRRHVSYQINNTEEMDRIREEKVSEVVEIFTVNRGVAQTELLRNSWDSRRLTLKNFITEGDSVCNANGFHESITKKCELCCCGGVNQKRNRGKEKSRKEDQKRAKRQKRGSLGMSLHDEIRRIRRAGLFEVVPVEDRMTELRLAFIGPIDSLWEKHHCSFVVSLDENFPYTSPRRIVGDTSLQHPNICTESGNVCLGIVENWNPQTGLIGVGRALMDLVRNPNWEHAVNSVSAAKYRESKDAFSDMLKQKILRGPHSNATAGSLKLESTPPSTGTASPSGGRCGDGSATYSLKCKHSFCKTCWNKYIVSKLAENGPEFIHTECISQDCEELINENLINGVCDEQVQLEYKKFLKRSIVDGGRQCKRCPNPRCNLVVFYPDERSKTRKIVCKCRTMFCWGCRKKCHAPVSCKMVEAWGREGKHKSDLIKDNLSKLSERIMATCRSHAEEHRGILQRRLEDIEREQRQVEARLLGLAVHAEAATSNFLDSDQYGEGAKPCPKCKKPTHKYRGCNHMTCKKPCGHQYCWVCLKDYGRQAGQCDSHCTNVDQRRHMLALHRSQLQAAQQRAAAAVEHPFGDIFNDMTSLVHVPVYDRTLAEFQGFQRLQNNVQNKCREIKDGVPLYASALQQIQESLISSLDTAMWMLVFRYFAGKPCTKVSTNAEKLADILPALNKLLRLPSPKFDEGFGRLRDLADRLEATHRLQRTMFEQKTAEGPDAPTASRLTHDDLVINETLLRSKLAERERAEREAGRERAEREVHNRNREERYRRRGEFHREREERRLLANYQRHPRDRPRPGRRRRARVFPEHREMTLVQMIQELVQRGFPEEAINCRDRIDLQNLLGHAIHHGLTAEMLARAKINFAAENDGIINPEAVTFREIFRSGVPISAWTLSPEVFARSRRNFASHLNRPVGSVTVSDVYNSSAGVNGWARALDGNPNARPVTLLSDDKEGGSGGALPSPRLDSSGSLHQRGSGSSRAPNAIAVSPEVLARSKRNFASHFDVPVDSVTVRDLHNSTAGLNAWASFEAIHARDGNDANADEKVNGGASPSSGSSNAPNTNANQAEGVPERAEVVSPSSSGEWVLPTVFAEEWEMVHDEPMFPFF